MAFNTPGIYIEEDNPTLSPIINAGTSNTVFFGFTARGPVHAPIALKNYDAFLRIFGAGLQGETAPYAIKGFFDNGGSTAYFVRMSAYDTSSGEEFGSSSSLSLDFDGGTAGDDTLVIQSGYKGVISPGVSGNNTFVSIALDPMHPATVGGDLSAAASVGATTLKLKGITGLQVGGYIKITEGANSDTLEIQRIASAFVGGAIEHTIYLVTPTTSAYTVAATVVSIEYTITVETSAGVVLETWSRLSPSPYSARNLDLVINDSQTGSEYITVTSNLGSTKGTLFTEIANNAALATGVALTGGSAENTYFDYSMFASSDTLAKGIHSVDRLRDAQLLCLPPNSDSTQTWAIQANANFHAIAIEYCKGRMNMFALLDAPKGYTPAQVVDYRNATLGADTYWAAMFYPHLKIQDPARPQSAATILVPPSGFVAGVMGRVDALPAPTGGVSAAAAGVSEFGRVDGVLGVEHVISDKEQEILNPIGVNCVRLLDRATGGKGVYIYGARTLSSDNNFKYIPLRRTLNYVEDTVRLSTQFAVFQKNGPELWSRMKFVIEQFLRSFWEQGNLAGSSTKDAYFVTIDSTTTSPQDIADGVLRGKIGVSLHRPAEFIVFTFTQTTNGSTVQE